MNTCNQDITDYDLVMTPITPNATLIFGGEGKINKESKIAIKELNGLYSVFCDGDFAMSFEGDIIKGACHNVITERYKQLVIIFTDDGSDC